MVSVVFWIVKERKKTRSLKQILVMCPFSSFPTAFQAATTLLTYNVAKRILTSLTTNVNTLTLRLVTRLFKKYKLKIKKWRRKKAFTLIELLVVISIIGILAAFIVASFTSAQAKARDSRRKADLNALQKALELAKGDSRNASYYPGCTTASPCNANVTLPALATAYIKAVPTDPSSSSTQYQYTSGCTTNYCATTYTLKACLENANDPQGVTPGTAPCTAAQANYTITNP